MFAIYADRDRGLGALEFGVLASCCPANRASTIPLRNAAACRRAQDDDAKHDSSPGASRLEDKSKKKGAGSAGALFASAWLQNATRWTPVADTMQLSQPVRPGTPLARDRKCPAAYLRVAHIYMLISMPTDTSTIFGAFQAISLSLCDRTTTPLQVKVMRIKKFAS
jgi:hypothetical protein